MKNFPKQSLNKPEIMTDNKPDSNYEQRRHKWHKYELNKMR